ncbi:MAG TPA: GNAT family N-acetyltransferase [Candidatus Kryptonia bacterium]|nr:GNAT family N-acetyltransferase [Candidatus Kryptonia bacterium]
MDQLLFRQATAHDTEALVAFTADVLRHQDAAEPDASTAAWTRDLLSGRHPRFRPGDFSIVEDPATHRIVSCASLISQTWMFDRIPIRVGQPELIGTDPAYRGRGLVRRQFEVLHRWSAARGHHLLAIDGVPYFYRQFGYEMALERYGGRVLQAAHLLIGDTPYRVRQAVESDLTFIADTARQAAKRSLLTCERDDALWTYELSGHDPMSFYRTELRTIVGPDESRVGFFAHAGHTARLAGATLALYACELASDAWEAVTPTILMYLKLTGTDAAAKHGDHFRYIGLWMGTEHPFYAAIDRLAPQVVPSYAWYLRVPDLAGFLRHVAPALDRRLDRSAWSHYSGELRLSFYRDGLRLRFQAGKLMDATQWQQSNQLLGVERLQPTTAERADAFFPGLTFLQLLFGYRSLEELQYAFPDCLVRTDEARALLDALFPQRPSSVWPAV